MSTRTIVVDGLSVETTDAGAIAIEKLQAQNKVLTDNASQVLKDHDTAMAGKDTEIATKDAEIKKLKDERLDDAAIDARVAERAAVIDKANKHIEDGNFSKMSNLDIKKAVVDSVHGDTFTQDKSDAYVEAAYDLTSDPKPDKVGDALKSRKIEKVVDNGQSVFEDNLRNAWKNKEAV